MRYGWVDVVDRQLKRCCILLELRVCDSGMVEIVENEAVVLMAIAKLYELDYCANPATWPLDPVEDTRLITQRTISWSLARKTILGGSFIGSLFGGYLGSDWGAAINDRINGRKTEEYDLESRVRMQKGSDAEIDIMYYIMLRNKMEGWGYRFSEAGLFLWDEDPQRIGASPDGLCYDTKRNEYGLLEFKCTVVYQASVYHISQCQMAMECVGKEIRFVLLVLWPSDGRFARNDEVVIYRIERDPVGRSICKVLSRMCNGVGDLNANINRLKECKEEIVEIKNDRYMYTGAGRIHSSRIDPTIFQNRGVNSNARRPMPPRQLYELHVDVLENECAVDMMISSIQPSQNSKITLEELMNGRIDRMLYIQGVQDLEALGSIRPIYLPSCGTPYSPKPKRKPKRRVPKTGGKSKPKSTPKTKRTSTAKRPATKKRAYTNGKGSFAKKRPMRTSRDTGLFAPPFQNMSTMDRWLI